MRGRRDGPRRRLEDWKRTPVWRLLAPCTRLVLERMVTFGNGSGVCFPSVRTLAMLSDCHKATVERALAESKAVGILLTLGPPVPRKGVRGPGSVPYEVALPPKSVAELEEHVRVARGLRGREGRRLLTRVGIVRHRADNLRDRDSGRFTAELSATVRTTKLSATMRTDPLVFPQEGKPEGKPDGSLRRMGAPPTRPLGSPTPPSPSQGMAAKEEGGGPPCRTGGQEEGHAPPPGLGWVAPMSERAHTRSVGRSPVSRKELTHIEAILPAVVPGTPDGAWEGGRVPHGPAPAPGSVSRESGRPEGPEGPAGIGGEPDLAADADRLLATVLGPPGMQGIPRSTIRLVQEPETEEEAREVGRQMEVLRDHLAGFVSPPSEYHKAQLLKRHFRPELIEAVVLELHGCGGGA